MIDYIPDRKRDDKSRLDSQTDEVRVPDHGFSRSKKPEVKTRNGEEQAAAAQPVEASEPRAHHATVEDIDDVSNDSLQASATAGADDFGASLEIVRSSDQRQQDGGQKYSGEKRGRTYHAMTADITNDKHRPVEQPVYAKIHVDYISTETLRYYAIPWEYDRVSPTATNHTSRPHQDSSAYGDRLDGPQLHRGPS